MSGSVNCGLTCVNLRLPALPALSGRGQNQPMVDKETRKGAIRAGLEKLEARGVGPSAVIRRLKDSGLPQPKSRQAVYKWFETGAVDDKYIPALAFAVRADSDQLQLYGQFKAPRPTAEDASGEYGVAFDIYSAARNIPEEQQRAVLNILEILASLQPGRRHARKKSTDG